LKPEFDSRFLRIQFESALHRKTHRKNNFAEEFKILLNTDLKIILLDHQNNFVGTLKMSNAAKNVYILATGLSVLHYYFDSSTKLLF